MDSRVTAHIPDRLLPILREGLPALLATAGADRFPALAFTWVVATGPTSLRFGADQGSATLANLEREGRAAIHVVGEGNLVFLIKGTARAVKPQLEATPFKIAMIEMIVTEVKDQSWPGVTPRPLGYDWSPESRQEMRAMERAVYAEMREWRG